MAGGLKGDGDLGGRVYLWVLGRGRGGGGVFLASC